MSSSSVIKKFVSISFAEKLFFVLFSLYAALSTCNLTYGTLTISIVMWPSLILGLVIFIYRLIHFKSYIKMPFCILMILLFLSIGISTLANYQYELKRNIISCVYWLFFFFVLYIIKQGSSNEKIKKDFCFNAAVFIALVSVFIVLSFVVFLCEYNKTIKAPDGFTFYVGFKIGRLWGVFLNLNRGAVSAGVSSVLLIYFIKTIKKIWFRILAGLIIALNTLFISLSDSRTGALCLGLGLAFFTFFLLVFKFKDKKFLYKAIAVLCAGLMLVLGFLLPRIIKDSYNTIIPIISKSGKTSITDDSDQSDYPIVERGYDLSDDISNRRFDVWKSGIQIVVDSPKNIIIGTSFYGLLPYTKDHLPNAYIISNDFDIISTMDNDFLNLLVGQGSLGMVLLILLAGSVVVLIFKNFTKQKEEDILALSTMLSVLFSIVGCSLFTSLIFYYFSQNAIVFWSFLGMSVYMLSSKRRCLKDE